VAWNRALTGDPVAGYSALEWSVTAMREVVGRLAVLGGSDRAAVFAAVSDAVWAVTMVDAAMVRYHVDVYDRVLAAEPSAERQLIEESLAGLRFVRNQIRDEAVLATFVEPGGSGGAAGHAGARGWIWKSVTEPRLPRRRPRARTWEAARCRAYQTRLAGDSVGEVFERAEAFLQRTAEQARVNSDIGD
jgi:hypothetical protein